MQTSKEVSNYRLEQAERFLRTARLNFADEDYKSAANRSYYCIFHCMRSILALEAVDFKKHSGVISYFREKYIKTEVFDKQLSKIIDLLFELRTASDYDDFFVVSKAEIETQIGNAEYFYLQVKDYLDKH